MPMVQTAGLNTRRHGYRGRRSRTWTGVTNEDLVPVSKPRTRSTPAAVKSRNPRREQDLSAAVDSARVAWQSAEPGPDKRAALAQLVSAEKRAGIMRVGNPVVLDSVHVETWATGQ